MSRMVRSILAVAMLLAIALPAAPAFAAPRPTKATISGFVYGSDGIAIPGASVGVYLANKNGVYNLVATLATDASGWWSFAGKGGPYRLDFSAPSVDPQSQWIATVDGVSYPLDVTLRSYGSLAGSVSDASALTPIAGANVELYLRNADGSWPTVPSATLTTLGDGTFASDQIPAGRYRVRVSAAGYASTYYGSPEPDSATVVFVRRGEAVSGIGVSLALLSTSGTISGRVVRYASETPVRGAFVWLYKQNADGSWPPISPGWGTPTLEVLTDSLGNYTSGQVPLGNYKVRFFTSMTGSQWWQYVATFDLATTVSITYGGQAITGIDGWFNKP